MAQDWHAEILMPRAVNIHAHHENVEDKSSVPECGGFCTFLLISKDKGLQAGWVAAWSGVKLWLRHVLDSRR